MRGGVCLHMRGGGVRAWAQGDMRGPLVPDAHWALPHALCDRRRAHEQSPRWLSRRWKSQSCRHSGMVKEQMYRQTFMPGSS